LNYKFEKIEDKTCFFKRQYTGIGEWSSYDGEDLFELLYPGCELDLSVFPTNTPKQTDESVLAAILKNIESCSVRICNLGKADSLVELHNALDNLRYPKTYQCNWRIEKYLLETPEPEYISENEDNSVDTFENPTGNVQYLNLRLNRYFNNFNK
jgi:hypothetical protein